MKTTPRCPLCSGRLERHKQVVVSYGSDGVSYDLAWVCTACSAAFPIAVTVEGFFGRSEPMYRPPDEAT